MEMHNGVETAAASRGAGPRHSILDLAPLELECLSVLWPLGEGTVRDIHGALAAARPRAYTTVMTIMDRLAQKGIVERRKVGKAFHYRARLSAEEARGKAVEKIVEGFFDGSRAALAAHLAALAGTARESSESIPTKPVVSAPVVDAPAPPVAELQTQNLDDTLL
jgi:predicted transcriptional regulator